MRIIQQDRTCLVLRQRLVGLRYLCGFAAILGLFLFLGYEFPVDGIGLVGLGAAGLGYQLTSPEVCCLNRATGLMTLKNSLGQKSYHLGQLQRVTVKKEVFLGTDFYRVYLQTQAGDDIALTRFPTTHSQQQLDLARAIHRFLDPQGLKSILPQ